ncbi:MAG: ribosomal protein S18-alanine N-acetyltransferase [Filifactoraceae bacterium]
MNKEIDCKKIPIEGVRVVPMDKSHVDVVFGIEEQCFVTPWSRMSIAKEMKNPLAHYFIVFIGDREVGYGGFWTILDEANINNIAIKDEFRGMGFGNIILEQLILKAKELSMKRMILEVRSSNNVAQSLYKKFGFKMVGLRKDYYQDIIEDAIIMEKVI